MTTLQDQMILKIAHHKLNLAFGKPVNNQDTETWIGFILEIDDEEALFNTLLKAGLVYRKRNKIVTQNGVRLTTTGEDVVGLTEAGFDAYLNIKESASTVSASSEIARV